MSEINKEENKEILKNEQEEAVDASNKELNKDIKEKTVEEKLKESEEKLLRSLAEIENQRRRFEKEIKDAFEFGLDNLWVRRWCRGVNRPKPLTFISKTAQPRLMKA